MNALEKTTASHTASWALLLVALVVGTHLRIDGAATSLLDGDEHHSVEVALQDPGTILRTFDAFGSHVLQPLLQHLALEALGTRVLALRLPALVAGLLALWAFYPLARRLVGHLPAVLGTLLFAINPMHVFYSHYARPYSMLVLVAMLLTHAVQRSFSAERKRGWVLAAVLLGALLPYVHLTGAALVGALGLAALARAAVLPQRGRALGITAGALLVTALLCALLYLPAMEQVLAFYGDKTTGRKDRPLGWFGIPTLLAGTPWMAMIWVATVPVALAVHARTRREGWLAAAVLGALIGLLATRPHGMTYAWSRYLITAIPFCLMALAWGAHALTRRIGLGDGGALLAGLGLAVALHVTGPQAPALHGAGTLSNSYLALRNLPAFDTPYPGTPGFYADLGDASGGPLPAIIEVPPIRNRGALLYRNYALQHGRDVWTPWGWPGIEAPLPSPYVWLDDPELAEHAQASHVVVHLDFKGELRRYFAFVRESAWPAAGSKDREFMERMLTGTVKRLRNPDLSRTQRSLTARYGQPVFQDDWVQVWELR